MPNKKETIIIGSPEDLKRYFTDGILSEKADLRTRKLGTLIDEMNVLAQAAEDDKISKVIAAANGLCGVLNSGQGNKSAAEFTAVLNDIYDFSAIRTYRLGDGYSLEHIAYRIENKNMEMPLSVALRYEGIQREYALCIRQIQIQLYRKPEAERLHLATYREVQKSSELLFYLQKNDIHSLDDFKRAVANADELIENLKNEKSELLKKIAEEEKLIEEIPKYLEVLSRRPLLARDIKELAKYNYIKDAGVKTAADTDTHREKLLEMKSQLEGMEEKISDALDKRKEVYDFYNFYESRMKTDYEILLEQAKAEMENIRLAKKKAEQETEQAQNVRSIDSVHRAVR